MMLLFYQEADMNYRIEAQSKRRIRVRLRLRSSKLTEEEARILEYAFSGMPGVTKVTVYRATGGCALEYDCGVGEILRRLDRFRFENVEIQVGYHIWQMITLKNL